jgi:MFS family permease
LDAYSSFRSRDYRLLLAGNFLSNFGSQMVSVAVAWDLYVATKSPLVLGNVGLVQVAPFLLFALSAGHFADRHDRRRIMLITQLPFFAASGLLIFGFHSVALIYGCLFLMATARAFQWPARQAMLPHVVPLEILGNAIAWNSSAPEIASVTGPAVAGLLVARAGSSTVYVLQTVFAILTLICYFGIRSVPVPEAEPANGARPAAAGGLRSIMEGLRFVKENKLILSAVSLDLFAVLFGGATALLPIFSVDILHIGVQGLGWLRAAPSLGAVSMALITAHLAPRHSAGKVMLWGVAGFGVATIVFGLSHSAVLSFAMLVLTGAFDNISVILRHSLVQTHTPDRLRGRVMSVNSIFISCSNQFGAVESGWTAAWFGAIPSVVGGGFATIAVVLACAALFPSLRRWKQ